MLAARVIAQGVTGVAILFAHGALAQSTFPDRPPRLIVPFAAGGSSDVVGRVLAEKMGVRLGQNIVVENRTGGGGIIGSEAVARARPDGYMLLLAIAATHAIQPAIGAKLPYDAVRDFTAIGQVGGGAIAISVAAAAPWRSMKDLADTASKSLPMPYGTGGHASGGHLVGEALRSLTGTALTHVPYKGGAPALNDLIAGHLQLVLTDTGTTTGYARSGKVRVIAVAGPKRSAAFPDVPTLLEQGIAFGAGSWFGLFGPPGLPPAIVARLNEALNQALADGDLQTRFQSLGLALYPGTAEGFAQIQRDDIEAWAKVVRTANIKLEQ